MNRLASCFLAYRYLLASILLALLMVSYASNGHWGGDFWHHSAVVRELKTHPVGPHHPQLLLNAPHAFFTPYHLTVACLCRITSWAPVTGLAVAGIVNLVLLLGGLAWFASALIRAKATSFYTLVFTLFWWSGTASTYSGFCHFKALGGNLPLPSTFALGLALTVLAMFIRLIRTGSRTWFIPIAVVTPVVLLTHPLSFIVLVVGLASLAVGLRWLALRDYALLACVFVVAFLLAGAWPYYPFFRLIGSASWVYDESNRRMYIGTMKSMIPAMLGLPLVAWRFKSNWRDPLALMFLGLVLVYAYGGVSKHWSYGRVLPSIALTLHLALAEGAARVESRLARTYFISPGRQLGYLCLFLVVFFGLVFTRTVKPALPGILPGGRSTFREYLFLGQATPQYEVVLADLRTSWLVPTFGGKVVAARMPLAFVPDQQARRDDVERFFVDSTSYEERLQLIAKYGVAFLLLNKDELPGWRPIAQCLAAHGRVVESNSVFELIDLRSNAQTKPG